MKYLLLSDEHVQAIAEGEVLHTPTHPNHGAYKASVTRDESISMAMELMEYRKIYGPLGCAWLENAEKPEGTK